MGIMLSKCPRPWSAEWARVMQASKGCTCLALSLLVVALLLLLLNQPLMSICGIQLYQSIFFVQLYAKCIKEDTSIHFDIQMYESIFFNASKSPNPPPIVPPAYMFAHSSLQSHTNCPRLNGVHVKP